MTTLPRILSIACLLALWLVLASVSSPNVVPGPVAVFKAMAEDVASGQAFYHLYKTLVRVGFGLILTMVLGIGVGTMMGLSRTGEIFLDSWVMVGLTVPAVVYSIICLLWFGLNDVAAIAAIGISAFPAVAISIWQGIKGIDTQLVAMGNAFRLEKSTILRKIIFP